MSDRETVDFLATVPLLEGRDEADLVELARRRAPADGAGRARSSGARAETARELVFIVDGAVSASLRLPGDRTVEIWTRRPGRDRRRDRAARRRRAHDERARDRDRDGARARPARLRGAARPPGSVGVQAEAPPRVAVHRAPAQPARAPRGLARRRDAPARGPRMRRGRSPSSSTAARPTASTCAAWRPSTTSTRWRSGAS